MDAFYAPQVAAQIPRFLSLLDREPHSASSGSFDREHWGWKFRDFPLVNPQMALAPLALLWRHAMPGNPCCGVERVRQWIEAAVRHTCLRQHRNGSFDTVAPNTQDYGMTMAIAHYLAVALQALGGDASPIVRETALNGIARACEFGLRGAEKYAFITNHQALFALAFLDGADLLGDARYARRADDVIAKILERQSTDGWYREYEGPDPGYESLGIFYLSLCWRRTRRPELLESLRRSVEFHAHCVHPDGSIGGVYGSRHTSLYFPGGFEVLSGALPMAAAVARFMRPRLERNNVVTPAVVDAMNLPPLMYSYIEASLANRGESATPALPCEALEGVRRFTESGITVAAAPAYYAVINASKGGVCRVFDRAAGTIAYEDAGYLVEAEGRRWTSQLIGLGESAGTSCQTRLAEVRQELPTPMKFLALRLLNLTLFRSASLGAWLQRLILDRLILRKRLGPFRLERSVSFGADEIRFRDRLTALRRVVAQSVEMPRSFMAIHMGSAKYFHTSDLDPAFEPQAGAMALAISRDGVAHREFVLRFEPAPKPELTHAHAEAPAQ